MSLGIKDLSRRVMNFGGAAATYYPTGSTDSPIQPTPDDGRTTTQGDSYFADAAVGTEWNKRGAWLHSIRIRNADTLAQIVRIQTHNDDGNEITISVAGSSSVALALGFQKHRGFRIVVPDADVTGFLIWADI